MTGATSTRCWMAFDKSFCARPRPCVKGLLVVCAIVSLMAIASLHQRPERTYQLLDTALNTVSGLHMTVDRTDWTDGRKRLCSVVPEVPSWDEYYDYVEEHHRCKKEEIVGGQERKKGGAKSVCLDPGLELKRNNCIVLSFGINNDFSFDDAMADQKGCDVFSFDPTMNTSDHRRGKRVRFLNLGLGPKDGVVAIKTAWWDKLVYFKVDSYHGILKRLNFLNSTIDYLKMDIEESELFFFRNTIKEHPELLGNIKQIGMEIHSGRYNTKLRDEFWWHLHQLRCLGFRPVYVGIVQGKKNLYDIGQRMVSAAYEIVWIQDAFLHK